MSLQIWWTVWGELIRKLVALVASFSSLAGLLIAFLPSPRDFPWWATGLLAWSVVFLILLVVLEFLGHQGRRVYAKSDTEGIRNYMHDWVKHGGRVAIWTRDMSWANNTETNKLLTEKAKRDELILCMPQLHPIATELEAAGADVCAYGAGNNETPASRFTIAFFGRDGARVAVGRAEGDTHVIDEFSAGSHPAFYLAADLITLARSLKGRRTG